MTTRQNKTKRDGVSARSRASSRSNKDNRKGRKESLKLKRVAGATVRISAALSVKLDVLLVRAPTAKIPFA